MDPRPNLHLVKVGQINNCLPLPHAGTFLNNDRLAAAGTLLRSVNHFPTLRSDQSAGFYLATIELQFLLFHTHCERGGVESSTHLRHRSLTLKFRTLRFPLGVLGSLGQHLLVDGACVFFQYRQFSPADVQIDLSLGHFQACRFEGIDCRVTQTGLISNSLIFFLGDRKTFLD